MNKKDTKDNEFQNDDKKIKEEKKNSIPSGSKVIFNAEDMPPVSEFTPMTIDKLLKIFEITLFHPSLGLIILPFSKAFFNASISLNNIWTQLCLFQVIISIIYQGCKAWIAYKSRQGEKRKWNEEIVVVTGGSNGLGLLLAQSAVQKFSTVCILDVVEPDYKQVGIYFYPCDISDFKQVEKTLNSIKDEFGKPTILINNAGVIYPKLITQSTVEEIDRTIQVNLSSHFYTTKIALPWMIEEGNGVIITVSSVLGYTSPAQTTSYSSTKGALIAFHESLTQELATFHPNSNIQTMLLVPGYMPTGMFAGVSMKYPFLFPELDPLQLTKKVMETLEYHHSGSREIFMPFYTCLGPFARAFPSSIREWVYNWTGANTSLLNWVGRRRDIN